jgi:glycosyltransferase involved in cell wall biosynthesis
MRFAFIVPFRNCSRFLASCAESLLCQDYENWVAYFRDDASSDAGLSVLPSDPRIVGQRREERGGGLLNMHEGIMENGLSPDNIVCLLDGDDQLVGSGVLGTISDLYERTGCLVSYGQYEDDSGQVGHCRAYRREEFANLRSAGFVASHLKTFRFSVYLEAMRQDPECERYRQADGRFFEMATDVAMMMPLLEIAGFERVAFNPVVVYRYNQHDGNEHRVDSARQNRCAREALAKPPFARLDF